MKNKLLIIVGILICINSCRMPSNPLGEIKIIKRGSIDTIDNCRDLDVDIVDDILVAAANYAGYFVYDINREGETISGLTKSFHKSSDEMDELLGDNQAEAVKLSTENNIAFILDKYENIWLYKYGDAGQNQFTGERLQTTCENYGAAWLSVAIDDQKGSIGLYFLLNHHSVESADFCVSQFNFYNNVSIIPSNERECSDIQEYFENYDNEGTCKEKGRCEDIEDETIELDQYNNQSSCEDNGHVWKYHEYKIGGCLAGDFAEYSTSLVWKKLDNVAPYDDHTDPTGDPDCEYIVNLESIAEKIYFNDGILSMTYGGLGVKIFEQSEENLCLTYDEDGDLIKKYGEDDMNAFCEEDQFTENVTCCITDACDPNAECEDPNYTANEGPFGLGGKYYSKGGIIPQIYSQFDTPGEVETVYSINHTIFAGLSRSNGFMIATLNDDGSVSRSHQFAVGYSIRGIHQYDGLLALAAGHDGILLYDWIGFNVSFLGKIETAYANNVKVAEDIIFVATEDGIEFIQIDR